jgi:lipopolysaccharide/colanic/teichoic acid biosynthesis glycosyltransferase
MLRILKRKGRPAIWKSPRSAEKARDSRAELAPLDLDEPFEVDVYPTPPAKRWLDATVASIALMLLSPLWLIAVVLIKLEGFGPVMIKQDRVGKDGRLFTFYKFRTMANGGENDISDRIPAGDLKTQLLSPREQHSSVTRIGSILRKTTIDELPQLVNVLKGDMSLVGPRPDMPEIVERWPAHFQQRHKVRPGMTGLAQVNGRSDLTHYEKIRYDLDYVRYHPLRRDLAILLKTVGLVLSTKGAR